MRLAFIVQRYGLEVNGGAERHCRELAEHVVSEPGVERVSVFSTCARDHGTWANHYAPGRSRLNGIELVRFPVRWERQRTLMSIFGPLSLRGRRLAAFETPWFYAQGPYVPSLVRHLRQVRNDFDAFVFFSYLYYPTIFGLPVTADRSLFIPTAHDEPALRTRRALASFRMAKAIAFNTEAERELVASLVDFSAVQSEVVGCGVDVDARGIEPERRERPYLLYIGRIESAKGIPELLEGFRTFRREHAERTYATSLGPKHGSDFELVLAGRAGGARPDGDPNVHWTGFVSEERRMQLLSGCEAVVIPGRLDSLSLSLLEAWALGKPTLAAEDCPVKRGHTVAAKAGALFGPSTPFATALDGLLSDPDALARSVEAGRQYVRSRYSWPVVMSRFMNLARYVAER